MPKAKKTPASATSRKDTKTVRTHQVRHSQRPSWRFSTVDLNGPFAWPVGAAIEAQILRKLQQFDSMNWHEIEGPDHHAIGVDRLSKEAQARLTEIKQDDIDEVFSFHFSGKPRIIGIRDMNVVKLLWWDPEHLVCPSQKKNT
jgi:hypothetical protein